MENINVTRSSMPPVEEYFNEIASIWDNRWLSNVGPKHQQLKQELSNRMDKAEIDLFCNGHQALEAAFSLFPAGSEVITTPFTFASTTVAILRCGLVPVFCDIEPNYYTIDPEKIEALITERTVAVAPVHVYGNLCDWRSIEEIAAKYGLKVIYDAAHAFGVRDGETDAGCLGDISMFSFHATKVFHTIEGGCLAHHDPSLSDIFTAWRNFGIYNWEQSEVLGTNAKMTEFSAAMGLCNLRHLEEQIILRRNAALRYRDRLMNKTGLVLCREQPGVTSNYAYFPIQVEPEQFGGSRDDVADHLAQGGIFTRKYFYPLTSGFQICQKQAAIQPTPVAAGVSNRILCLPLYADLTTEVVDRICDAVLEVQRR